MLFDWPPIGVDARVDLDQGSRDGRLRATLHTVKWADVAQLAGLKVGSAAMREFYLHVVNLPFSFDHYAVRIGLVEGTQEVENGFAMSLVFMAAEAARYREFIDRLRDTGTTRIQFDLVKAKGGVLPQSLALFALPVNMPLPSSKRPAIAPFLTTRVVTSTKKIVPEAAATTAVAAARTPPAPPVSPAWSLSTNIALPQGLQLPQAPSRGPPPPLPTLPPVSTLMANTRLAASDPQHRAARGQKL